MPNLSQIQNRPKMRDTDVAGKAVERQSNVVFLSKAKAGHYDPKCFQAKDPAATVLKLKRGEVAYRAELND